MNTPLWIDFPLHFDARGRTAETSYADHVLDMIKQVLFTTPGERVNRQDFGCGLLDLVFEPNSVELAATLQATTAGALQRWLGDVITVQRLEVTAEESTLRVDLSYVLAETGEERTEVIEGGIR
ncbi:GPW/gp25 family protein [Amycolatopsis sp. NPDC059027]|uniref:GPW/gp25 family protein n=1 Tax=unclassified Amycolatopsis TaxID=2618356 RepID=UPI0036701843